MTIERTETSDFPRINSFTFRPAWWCTNTHLQTIWRRLLGALPSVEYRRERLELPDGDFLDLDWAISSGDSGSSAPIVIVLHGLEGCSLSKYVLGLMSALLDRGCRGVAMNFRSCSGEINRLPRFYHSGETTDLGFVVSTVASRFPGIPIMAAGFSLGGNVLLKWLGENGDAVPDAFHAAAAVSVPYDLAVAAFYIDRPGFNRAVYSAAFLRTLKQKALEKSRCFPGILDRSAVRRIGSFAEFDEMVTAPLHGFESAREYWRRSSSIGYLSGIRRPTLLLSAEDDPFLPGDHLPRQSAAASQWLTAEFLHRGGHVGFITGASPFRPVYWADARIADFLIDPNNRR